MSSFSHGLGRLCCVPACPPWKLILYLCFLLKVEDMALYPSRRQLHCLTYGFQTNPSTKVVTWISPKVDACSKSSIVDDNSYGIALSLK